MGLVPRHQRIAAILGNRSRLVGPGRTMPPTRRSSFGPRSGAFQGMRYRGARGGFFSSISKFVGKVVSTVTRVPVLGAVAKAAIGSLPIVGQVVTAVNAFKGKTAVGVAASPVGGTTETAGTGGGATTGGGSRRPAGRRRKPKKTKTARRAKAKKGKRRSGTPSAKQIAARKRFAAAVKKGKIRKGQRL